MSEHTDDQSGRHDPGTDDLLEEQAGKGYGEDEGERERALPDEEEQQ